MSKKKKSKEKFNITLKNTTIKVKRKKNGKYKLKNIGKNDCTVYCENIEKQSVTRNFIDKLENKSYYDGNKIKITANLYKHLKKSTINGCFILKPKETRCLLSKNYNVLIKNIRKQEEYTPVNLKKDAK